MQMERYKDIFVLAVCWALTFSIATLLTFIAPAAAKNIQNSDFFATFSIAIFVLGNAACNIPSSYLFRKYGRKIGFLIGSGFLLFGSLVVLFGVIGNALWLLFSGCFLVGIGVGLGQFYRFAAIELATEDSKSWAVTTVLAGGCCAAFLGPTLGLETRYIFSKEYAGSILIMTILSLINIILGFFIKFPDVEETLLTKKPSNHKILNINYQKIFSIMKSQLFFNSLMLSLISQLFMIIIMINCTIEIHDKGFDMVLQSLVLDFHFLAMFGTGIITGQLISKHGPYWVVPLSWFILGLSLTIFLISEDIWSFFIGDFLLGVSWNIMYSAGTVLLSYSYEEPEQHEIQSVFEFIINLLSGIISIISGIALQFMGWRFLIVFMTSLFGFISIFFPVYYYSIFDSSLSHPSDIFNSKPEEEAFSNEEDPECEVDSIELSGGKDRILQSFV